jgi:hypothetical protein
MERQPAQHAKVPGYNVIEEVRNQVRDAKDE